MADNQQPRQAVKNLIIYTITNRVNGKVYVGQSRQGLARRKAEHIYRFNLGERDHKLYRAMKKHGLENFVFEVVCCALKSEYLNALEVEFINKFDSFHRGYNMTCGGDNISEETKAKRSASLKGRKITWYDKILATRKRRRAENGPLKRTIVGGLCSNSKSYLVRYPDGREVVVRGLRQFCRDNGLTHNLLIATLNGLQRHHKNFALLARFNDHPDREYSQAAGNGTQPASLAG